MPTMSTLFSVLAAAYRLVVTLWNTCIVFLQVMQSVMHDAQQEAAEVMALLDDGVPMDGVMSTSLILDPQAAEPANRWQMLIIARASSFVLLIRLSKRRVLHLEVDERFITAKLEVICTELPLHIQHVPRLLQMPIGTYDTRLVKYMPMKAPYLWKEEQAGTGGRGEVVDVSIVPAAPTSSISTVAERRSRRKKCVQLLTESALRRRLHMDRFGRVGLEATPKRGTGAAKTYGGNVVKRKALANATNMGITHAEEITDTQATGVAETPKHVRLERNMHTALSENLSIPNMVEAASSRKAIESTQQPRRSGSLRRKRGQFDLYAQGITSEFSLLSKLG